MQRMRKELRARGVTTLAGLIDSVPKPRRFYRALPDAMIRDEGIRIDY